MSELTLLDSRYQVLRTVGSGGMGVVYLVIDRHRENKIMALKTCKAISDTIARDEFRSEFRNIRGVKHPHIPQVFDFGTLPGPDPALYFTCEFVDGDPLDTLTRDWSPQQLRTVLVSLSRALAFLHSRSMLHRDLKPDNVLGRMSSRGDFDLFKLVDFGLAATHDGSPTETAGTLDYLAPEIVAGAGPSVAADLYSMGMLAYQLAAGRLPFEGDDPMAIARQRTKLDAPSPLRFRPDLPVGLADVIQSLVRRRPEDRPASARHVIALLNEREGTQYEYETPETSSAYIRSAVSYTHAAARNQLTGIKDALAAGELPAPTLISGPAGLGKARLISEFATELTLSGISCRVVRSDADLGISGDPPRAIVVPFGRELSNERIAATFSRLSGRRVWWLVGRSSIDDDLRERMSGLQEIRLKPLSIEDVAGFIEATFPENTFPEDFGEALFADSMGVTSEVQGIFDHLQARELLRIGLAGWELLPGEWELPELHDAATYIQSCLSGLSEDAAFELSVLSCSRTPLPTDVLDRVHGDCGRSPEQIVSLRTELQDLDWVVNTPDGSALRFRAVRRWMQERLPDGEIQEIHRRLHGAWTESVAADDARRGREALYHDFMGQTWKSTPGEAERILDQALSEESAGWVRKLLRTSLQHRPPIQLCRVISEMLARTEYIEGNLSESAAVLRDYLRPESTPVSRENLRLMARFATLEEKLGRTENSERVLRQCLEILSEDDRSAAGSVFGTLAWIAFKKGEQEQARELAENGLVRMTSDAADPGFAVLLNTVATLAFYRGEGETAAAYWQRCLEVSKLLGDRKSIANMYNNLGVLAAQSGDRIRARSLWEQCAEISREIKDTHRLAGIYNNLGIDALETGSFRDAEEYYLKSLTLFRRMESPREQVETLSNLGELAFYRADYPRAMAYFRESVNLATELGDRECQVEPMVYLGKLLTVLEQVEDAERILLEAQGIAHEIGVKKGEGQAWEGLADLYARMERAEAVDRALERAHTLLPNDVDPLAALHLNLTECRIAAEDGDDRRVIDALARAREVADTKWDPFTAARTEVYGLLFADETLDSQRVKLVQRRLSAFPEFLWNYHWAMARRRMTEGAVRKALDEFGRGVSVLKVIASRLNDDDRARYLKAPHILRFKSEAMSARESMTAQDS